MSVEGCDKVNKASWFTWTAIGLLVLGCCGTCGGFVSGVSGAAAHDTAVMSTSSWVFFPSLGALALGIIVGIVAAVLRHRY